MRIAFVCTANQCRSPMAEHLCRRLLAERGIEGVEVMSSGVLALPGIPAIEGARRVAAASGLDLDDHRSQPFDPSLYSAGDLILVMERRHRTRLLYESDLDPDAFRLLGEFADAGEGLEVTDPVGGSEQAFKDCFVRLEACIHGLVAWLEEERISRS